MRFPYLKKWFENNPVYILIVIGIPLLVFSLIMDFRKGLEAADFYGNLTASVIDIFMLGIVVIVYNKLSERKERIIRYQEEIDGYRPWKENEATYRICGIIRSLNILSVSDINLNSCYLPKAPLKLANLQGASLKGANLQEANLKKANLQGANLRCANLQGANVKRANLQGAILMFANLQGMIVESNDWLEKNSIKGKEYIQKVYCVVEEETNGMPIFKIERKPEYQMPPEAYSNK